MKLHLYLNIPLTSSETEPFDSFRLLLSFLIFARLASALSTSSPAGEDAAQDRSSTGNYLTVTLSSLTSVDSKRYGLHGGFEDVLTLAPHSYALRSHRTRFS